MVFFGSMRNASQNMGLKIGNFNLLLSCRQGNIKSSSTPDKEESIWRDAVSTTQLANNTLNLDYPPYLFLTYFNELFSHVCMQRLTSQECQDFTTPNFIELKSIVTNK